MADARYSFLPWYRKGLASVVTGAAADTARASLSVNLVYKVDDVREERVPQSVDLLGPGDVTGIDPAAVVRVDPRPFSNDFEPNYLAAIEFFEEDYAWRYSPRLADGARLLPWLALVVLADGEFDAEAAPAQLVLKDASLLPPCTEAWAWAHTHVSGDSPDPAQPAALAQALAARPESGLCRILAARRLRPGKAWHAFLVPTFEAGRAAGLRIPREARELAWTDAGAVVLPVYHHWTFRTGPRGDFEMLAGLLHPAGSLEGVGQRWMSVSDPLPEFNLPPIGRDIPAPEPLLKLRGALIAPGKPADEWALNRDAFGQAVADFLNLAQSWGIDADLALVGDPQLPGGHKLPVVLPPSYGAWHADVPLLQPAHATDRWLEQINLDPRHRAAANFGTEVVQREQESLMARAWAQYGDLFGANAQRRRAQWMRELALALQAKHLTPLPDAQFLAQTAPTHGRIRAADDAPATVHGAVAASALPVAALLPAMRRLLRAGGPLARRSGLSGQALEQLVSGVARLEFAFAALPEPPPQRPSLALPPQLAGGRPEEWLGSDWDLLRPRIVALLAEVESLLPRLPSLAPTRDYLLRLLAQGEAQGALGAGQLTAEAVLSQRSRPRDWHAPGLHPHGHPSERDLQASPWDANFNFVGFNFQQAAANLHEWLEFPFEPEREPQALDVAGLVARLKLRLSPDSTVPEHVHARFPLPPRVPRPAYDPLDPVMPHPVFDDPTYLWLKAISQEHVVPHLGRMPENSVALLQIHWPFIESFLVGVNHEMARELLWRGYPTDQRGSCMRQFWDVRAVRGALAEDSSVVEAFRDIHPVHGWRSAGALTALGGNRPAGRSAISNVVLVVRGELLRRYPNTEVYAVRAVPNTEPRPEDFKLLANRRPGTERRDPILEAAFDPDIRCFGFDFDEAEARGSLAGPAGGLGWYFVFQERLGEPRFGLDEPANPETLFGQAPATAETLSWAHLAADADAYAGMAALHLARHRIQGAAAQPPLRLDDDDAVNVARWDSDAADMAALMLQLPARVYFHAADLLS